MPVPFSRITYMGTLTAGQFLPNETLTLDQQLLILRGVLQGIILPLRCQDLRW